MNSIDDIKHAVYINLLSRPDRKSHVEKQLSYIGIKAERFNAIKMANGAVGCSMSHLRCLLNAKEKDLDHILICEDDITFTDPVLFITQTNKFLKSQKKWDVLLLAGNNMPPYKKIDNYCIQVSRCQTTTGYLVKKHYFDVLIENIKTGINMLIRNSDKHKLFAIDKYWFQLQERDFWFLVIPLSVVQREDYSNIENKRTNYTNIMVDMDKKHLFKQSQIDNLMNMKKPYIGGNLKKIKFL